MKKIKDKRGQVDLDIGFYENFFNADEVNCIDQPIAAYANLFSDQNYFIYCMYIIFAENWAYPFPRGFLNARKYILDKLNLCLDIVPIDYSEIFLTTLKKNIDEKRPVILLLRRQTLVYDQCYGDIDFDSLHGILVSGYNSKFPVICIRDAAHIERSGAIYKGSGYGLFRLWLKDELIKEMWISSNELNAGTEFANIILLITSKKDINAEHPTFAVAIRDILCNGSFNSNNYLVWLDKVKEDITCLKDEEVSRQLRRIFILPKKAFFYIIRLACNEINIGIDELLALEQKYLNTQESIFNKLCIMAQKGELLEEQKYISYTNKISLLDLELEKFLKKYWL